MKEFLEWLELEEKLGEDVESIMVTKSMIIKYIQEQENEEE